jgi:hypothetical protein
VVQIRIPIVVLLKASKATLGPSTFPIILFSTSIHKSVRASLYDHIFTAVYSQKIFEELFQGNSGSGLGKPKLTAVGIRCADHATSSIR